MEQQSNRIYAEMPPIRLFFHAAVPGVISMVAVLWPLGLNGLWLNQAATYVPVGIIAFFMLRKTQKSLAANI